MVAEINKFFDDIQEDNHLLLPIIKKGRYSIIYSTKNTAFIAINTHKNSGEKFIESAINRGINVIISEHHYPQFENLTWIIVEYSTVFLQRLANYHF